MRRRRYEQGLSPMFAALTGGVGVLVGIDTAMAIGGVIRWLD